LWIWGGNSYGQLGLGNTIPVSSPTQIPGSWNNVACGSYNTLAQKRDGTLWCCGYNYNGEVGNNSLANLKYSSMVQVATSAVNWGILVGGNQAMGAN
jgi:alpha-tubulin suppressor-like RCC1 family protein